MFRGAVIQLRSTPVETLLFAQLNSVRYPDCAHEFHGDCCSAQKFGLFSMISLNLAA